MSAAFHKLSVTEVSQETADSVILRFAIPEPLRDAFHFSPGQHLALRAVIDGEDVRRNYSICSAPYENILRIGVKRVSGGIFSNWLSSSLKCGDEIDVMVPSGSFTKPFEANRKGHYVGIAGGSGITPILSLLKTALEVEPQSRFTLIYSNRDSASVMFLEELAQLKNRYMARLELYHFLSRESEDVALFNGRLTPEKCSEIFDTLFNVGAISDFFICGPSPMMDAAEAALLDRGVPTSQIHVERFSADRPTEEIMAALAAKTDSAAGTVMKLTLDGRTRDVIFDAKAGNILESARSGGLPAPYACKAGVCATCRAKVVSGEVTMAARYGLTDEEIEAGYILTCQAIPVGEGVALDYDA
jgi:ring-1,2-phenylacetyl-CoA epoxidase subunit PaaE